MKDSQSVAKAKKNQKKPGYSQRENSQSSFDGSATRSSRAKRSVGLDKQK